MQIALIISIFDIVVEKDCSSKCADYSLRYGLQAVAYSLDQEQLYERRACTALRYTAALCSQAVLATRQASTAFNALPPRATT